MTNFEFYKDKLSTISETSKSAIAIVNGKPTNCWNCLACENCDRHNNCWDTGLIKWLLSEHIEETDNYKVCKNLNVDDKILVSLTGDDWVKRYFARYDSENDKVVAFNSGATSWSADNTCVSQWKYVKLPEEEGEQE